MLNHIHSDDTSTRNVRGVSSGIFPGTLVKVVDGQIWYHLNDDLFKAQNMTAAPEDEWLLHQGGELTVSVDIPFGTLAMLIAHQFVNKDLRRMLILVNENIL